MKSRKTKYKIVYYRNKRLIAFCLLFLLLFIGIGYSVLSTDINILGSINLRAYKDPTLYNVLRNAAIKGTYAKEYTGSHHDSFTSEPSEKIYHWYANRLTTGDQLGKEISNLNNVIFAGYCWKMMRTTDTGGVKLIYNGIPSDGKCTTNTVTIGSSQITPQNVGGYPGYTYGGHVTTDPYYSTLLAHSSIGYMDKGIYLFSDVTDDEDTAYLPLTENILYEGDIISFGPTYNPEDAAEGELFEDVEFNSNGYYGSNYYNDTLAGLYIYKINDWEPDEPLYVLYYEKTYNGELEENNSATIVYYDNSAWDDDSILDNGIVIGESYTKNGDIYTLQNTQVVSLNDWLNYFSYEGYYICEGEYAVGNQYSCSEIKKIISMRNYGTAYDYLTSKYEYLYASGFTYDSVNNEYTLNSDRVSYWTGSLTTNLSELNTHHYTCLNKTGTCKYLAYTYGTNESNNIWFTLLKDGDSIENVLEDTIYADDINTVDSPIKSMIDTWYHDNILNTSYANQIEDVVYCNNRKITKFGAFKSDNGPLYESLEFPNYVPYNSNDRSPLEDLSCQNTRDSFSLNNTQAKLTYPIALPTAPEFEIIGNRYVLSSSTSSYWTMTPCSLGQAFNVYKTGGQPVSCTSTASNIGSGGGIRPVISIKPGVKYTSGNGSKDTPYIVEEP